MIRTDGKSNQWYVPLIKTIVDAFRCIPLAFILYLFPPFNGGYEAMFVPTRLGSKISFAWIILLVTAVGWTISIFGLFTSKRQNLLNMVFDDVVVDVHRIDKDEPEPTNHGRSY